MTMIYKIVPSLIWQSAIGVGSFKGAGIDIVDGYIHFSTAVQMRETAAKHFAGQTDLMLIAVDDQRLGAALKYEISRGGAPFPHLYAALDLADVAWSAPLPLGADGAHIFPEAAQ
jgi:uncharacterized protein (DUF952 family)